MIKKTKSILKKILIFQSILPQGNHGFLQSFFHKQLLKLSYFQVSLNLSSTVVVNPKQVLETYLSRFNPSVIKVNRDATHLALNAPQRHKRSYPTSYQISALNATQGHKPGYQQAIYISIPNDKVGPFGYINTGFQDHYLAVISKELVYKPRCISLVYIRIGY